MKNFFLVFVILFTTYLDAAQNLYCSFLGNSNWTAGTYKISSDGNEIDLFLEDYIVIDVSPDSTLLLCISAADMSNNALDSIAIYDLKGRVVKTLVDDYQTAGFKSVQWNATNDRNEPVSAGLYPYTLQIKDFIDSKKMILLK